MADRPPLAMDGRFGSLQQNNIGLRDEYQPESVTRQGRPGDEHSSRAQGTASQGVFFDWKRFPEGAKFEPTDIQILRHLRAKVKSEGQYQHPLIQLFIPTLEDGICGTHPEDLPGIAMDGSNRHFFHQPSRAYNSGSRKRRKVQSEAEDGTVREHRWHKTGKTRPVTDSGRQIGWKKILVLYESHGQKGTAGSRSAFGQQQPKDLKTQWIMHQYHVGQDPEEKEGDWVVSKVFFQLQPRQSMARRGLLDEEEVSGCLEGSKILTEEVEDEIEEVEDEEGAKGFFPGPVIGSKKKRVWRGALGGALTLKSKSTSSQQSKGERGKLLQAQRPVIPPAPASWGNNGDRAPGLMPGPLAGSVAQNVALQQVNQPGAGDTKSALLPPVQSSRSGVTRTHSQSQSSSKDIRAHEASLGDCGSDVGSSQEPRAEHPEEATASKSDFSGAGSAFQRPAASASRLVMGRGPPSSSVLDSQTLRAGLLPSWEPQVSSVGPLQFDGAPLSAGIPAAFAAVPFGPLSIPGARLPGLSWEGGGSQTHGELFPGPSPGLGTSQGQEIAPQLLIPAPEDKPRSQQEEHSKSVGMNPILAPPLMQDLKNHEDSNSPRLQAPSVSFSSVADATQSLAAKAGDGEEYLASQMQQSQDSPGHARRVCSSINSTPEDPGFADNLLSTPADETGDKGESPQLCSEKQAICGFSEKEAGARGGNNEEEGDTIEGTAVSHAGSLAAETKLGADEGKQVASEGSPGQPHGDHNIWIEKPSPSEVKSIAEAAAVAGADIGCPAEENRKIPDEQIARRHGSTVGAAGSPPPKLDAFMAGLIAAIDAVQGQHPEVDGEKCVGLDRESQGALQVHCAHVPAGKKLSLLTGRNAKMRGKAASPPSGRNRSPAKEESGQVLDAVVHLAGSQDSLRLSQLSLPNWTSQEMRDMDEVLASQSQQNLSQGCEKSPDAEIQGQGDVCPPALESQACSPGSTEKLGEEVGPGQDDVQQEEATSRENSQMERLSSVNPGRAEEKPGDGSGEASRTGALHSSLRAGTEAASTLGKGKARGNSKVKGRGKGMSSVLRPCSSTPVSKDPRSHFNFIMEVEDDSSHVEEKGEGRTQTTGPQQGISQVGTQLHSDGSGAKQGATIDSYFRGAGGIPSPRADGGSSRGRALPARSESNANTGSTGSGSAGGSGGGEQAKKGARSTKGRTAAKQWRSVCGL